MDRHLLSLESKFTDHGLKEARIGIKISKKLADHREGQILLWMTCNLICRLKGIIKEVEICVPHDTQYSTPAYAPFEFASSNLAENLSHVLPRCARSCKVVFVKDDLRSDLDAIILIGKDTTTHTKAEFVKNVTCNGWLSYIGYNKTFCDPEPSINNNPFGALAASCIVVGEVFKFLGQIKPGMGDMITSMCFSTYDFRHDLKSWEQPENPSLDKPVNLEQIHICGAGAVAHAFCQALFAIGNLKGKLFLIDQSKDPMANETIDSTNLARYIMASNDDEGKPKAELLAQRMSAVGIQIDFSDDGFASYVNNRNTVCLSHVVSCVDNNRTRHDIQDQIPKVIHGGSISDLRTQISIYDLGRDYYQCLKCYNPLESRLSDDDNLKRLRAMSPFQRREESLKRDIDLQTLENYIENPQCGELNTVVLQRFSTLPDQPTFSVNFVSALSGVLLAAEIVKTRNPLLRPVLGRNQKTDLYYTFLTNKCSLYISESAPGCWCNDVSAPPRDIHKRIWSHH